MLLLPGQPRPLQHAAKRCTSPPKHSLVVKADLSAGFLSEVANAALRSRLRSCGSVDCQVECSALGLAQGRLDAASLRGRAWQSPLNLGARVLEVELGKLQLDMQKLVTQASFAFQAPHPRGTARVVFDAADFAAFLVHPLMRDASRRAVQGAPFDFSQEGVALTADAGAHPGHARFSGVWQGRAYDLTLRRGERPGQALVEAEPAQGAQNGGWRRGAEATPASSSRWDSSSRSAGPRYAAAAAPQRPAQRWSEREDRWPERGERRWPDRGERWPERGDRRWPERGDRWPERGERGGSGAERAWEEEDDEGAELVARELSVFFSGLTLDLQGPQLRYRDMRFRGGSGGPPVLELLLGVDVLGFPPAKVAF